jgi:DNA invertase Pin-like site-specific DNA recombinase
MSKGQVVGYVRVSSTGQSTVRQLDGVETDRTFVDKLSGKSMERPELRACLEYLREGDLLVVHSMDRLARNLGDLKMIVRQLTAKGVTVQFVKEALVFTNKADSMGQLLLNILGAVAEFERELIRERQREGIEIAKRNGVYAGRKPSLKPDQLAEIRAKLDAGVSRTRIARDYAVSRQTVYTAFPV